MNYRLKRALSLTLCLLLFILPIPSNAEETPPSAEHLNMTTITVKNVRYNDGSGETELPFSLDLSIGADISARRALALINLTADDKPLTLMGSIENEEIRARISGIDPFFVVPLKQAEDELIKSTLLMGMDYNDISKETRAALDEYLVLFEESMLVPATVIESSDIVETMYPIETWREEYEKYPSLLNAVPAGEEEITLFGKVYTAKKYTYSMENATEEEFLAFYEAYDTHFYGATSDLDAAYEKLMELVYEDYIALMETNDVWTDDGSIEESESGSLSEWDESEQMSYLYSIEGTIWQVDEVLGMLEEYTSVTRGPEGEYTSTYVYSDMLTDGCMRTETSTTESDPYYGYVASYADSTTIETDESGRLLMEGSSLTSTEYADWPDYNYASDVSWRSEMTDERLYMTFTETTSGSYAEHMSMDADLALGQEDETGLINSASGTMAFDISYLGESASASMDVGLLMSSLPSGTLLPVAGETLNPFEAGEETLSQLMTDLEALIMETFGSLIPAPETPSSVGGALLG